MSPQRKRMSLLYLVRSQTHFTTRRVPTVGLYAPPRRRNRTIRSAQVSVESIGIHRFTAPVNTIARLSITQRSSRLNAYDKPITRSSDL